MKRLIILLFLVLGVIACLEKPASDKSNAHFSAEKIQATNYQPIPGAENLAQLIPLLKGKRVGLVVNHTSQVGDQHLIDTLLSLEVQVKKIYTPEHGFSGTADAGEKVEDSKVDAFTEIPIISLYGKKRKPLPEDMEGIDLVVFDIQDVGVRFYTYISTMHHVMESCAEQNLPFIVLDRPNPNGHYVDGPILEKEYRSFVGMHPIPLVHGLTVGELAQMINGEKWLAGGLQVDLTVIKNLNYTHATPYELPIPPSPNLPDQLAVLLYPSTCLFEGTVISEGRGTSRPFVIFGHPAYEAMPYSFTPAPNEGSKHPKLQGQLCYGYNLSNLSEVNFRAKGKLELKWLIEFYQKWPEEGPFFLENGWIDKLAGTKELRKQIESGLGAEEIRESWQEDLNAYKLMRSKYLLYADFE